MRACILTGVGQVQVGPAGVQDSGVDARHHVGLVHHEVHHVVVGGQLPLQASQGTAGISKAALLRARQC